MIEFTMPALGSDMDEGTLTEWLVKPGDRISRGQVVAIVETTKAAVEIECWQEGTVNELVVAAGETVQVGTVLATLLEPGERVAATPPTTPHRRRWVSPAARRLARSLNVDIDNVRGTGPQGAVTLGDVEHAAKEAATKPATETTAADRAAAMRRSIAVAMSRSKREIPHYYLADEIPMETSLTWLSARNAQRSITERVLPAVLQLKAVARAARRFGEFNGFWRDGGFQPATAVHIGVAISLRGGGLVAPAIHDVADKKLDELMADLTDLVARARAGSLRSSEMSDPTITVTNLGDQGVDTVFGVIYPPQVALVGFGKPTQRVCVIDGGIRVVTAVRGTLAADHRASDGHRGALFLAAINELLQQPDLLEK
ncbi:2-oxo acid dehydrogenase subunit E2 [Mycobacterium shinjukuense]|uniref:Dihydrolipoamide acetyltransferase component of pyruvate dehydrogenase complex n=1 Tax=Mycobacterium shinjukuense TaxID=398694 RepID=A0A7I7MLB1_9MYCO|nr:dihydrolipoamide acetyltransferase family protein [Mycobacterium shinjukuense]MCV6984340.1 2-oxo acid dehydrogenase subunit E2 [Mycobacterium shinjukuense]ORB70952.1 branched-chain alpha-keto acid dehydrogenase subunit E2 [Mycobacterium shinjukuense]BBX73061.1 dihydrolipoamide acetyltransferase component of pyruvate dehydrogenase complex [Mycobacterium shinjukuense]